MLFQKELLYDSSYEDDFLVRIIGAVGRNSDIALTELVANAWDAGALKVNIIIPTEKQNTLVIEDDGCGMSKDEFLSRWMKLGYNRILHQGSDVTFPRNSANRTRKAYGRNGIGRHGMLCFSDTYEVMTWKEGILNSFVVKTSTGKTPFIVEKWEEGKKEGSGTILKVTVEKNLPDADVMRDVLSARFLHDPDFMIYVNGVSVNLEDLPGFIDQKEIEVTPKIKMLAHAFDSTKTAHTKQRQGAAFWVNNRLVGEPTWDLGQKNLTIDGRTQFGKKYNFIFKSDDIDEYVLPDWTGFQKNKTIDLLYFKASEYIQEILKRFYAAHINETKEKLFRDKKSQIKELSSMAKFELEEFVNNMIDENPTLDDKMLFPAISAIIRLEKTRSGKALLEKISKLNENDIDALNTLLGSWSLQDTLTVLEEIDKRISVIEAIKRLSAEKNTQELTILHPLLTQARWIFGPEFESSEYSSNITLVKAVEGLFGKKIDASGFLNPRKRPDLIILDDATVSIVDLQEFDSDNTLSSYKEILIIELKKGYSKIGREEMNQAEGYVQDLLNCTAIAGDPRIRAFVVGYSMDSKTSPERMIDRKHIIKACTYHQLILTAEKRMFKLKEQLREHYDNIPTDSLLQKVLNEPEQKNLAIELGLEKV